MARLPSALLAIAILSGSSAVLAQEVAIGDLQARRRALEEEYTRARTPEAKRAILARLEALRLAERPDSPAPAVAPRPAGTRPAGPPPDDWATRPTAWLESQSDAVLLEILDGPSIRRVANLAAAREIGRILRDRSYRPEDLLFFSRNTLVAHPDEELVAMARDSVESAWASVTIPRGRRLVDTKWVDVDMPDGTRASVSFAFDRLHVSFDRPLVGIARGPAPNMEIRSLSYDFASGSFGVDTRTSFDWLGASALYERIGRDRLAAMVRPLLPEAMRRPGYRPSRDPDLARHAAELADNLRRGLGGGAPSPDGPTPVLDETVRDPSAGLTLRFDEEIRFPLDDSGFELVLAAGQPISLSASTAGTFRRRPDGTFEVPPMKAVHLSAHGGGITVRSTGKGVLDGLKAIDIHHLTLHPDGRIEMEYDLEVENAIRGGIALLHLLALAGAANGGPVPGDLGRIPDVKLEAIRTKIDALVREKAPPALAEFVRKYDGVVPHLDLSEFLGISR